jgi:NAD(P)-dependent dehydrogenase (short-subunit alcohol dehydrogenase family)
MGKLEGKIAFIAGSAKGIGKAIAERFAAEGACVACADIDAEGAGAVVARIQAAGGRALAIDCDVTDSAAVASAVAVNRHGIGTPDRRAKGTPVKGVVGERGRGRRGAVGGAASSPARQPWEWAWIRRGS